MAIAYQRINRPFGWEFKNTQINVCVCVFITATRNQRFWLAFYVRTDRNRTGEDWGVEKREQNEWHSVQMCCKKKSDVMTIEIVLRKGLNELLCGILDNTSLDDKPENRAILFSFCNFLVLRSFVIHRTTKGMNTQLDMYNLAVGQFCCYDKTRIIIANIIFIWFDTMAD